MQYSYGALALLAQTASYDPDPLHMVHSSECLVVSSMYVALPRYMGTTLPGLLLLVPYLVSEERSPAPDTC
jgi:hypothetical protein